MCCKLSIVVSEYLASSASILQGCDKVLKKNLIRPNFTALISLAATLPKIGGLLADNEFMA